MNIALDAMGGDNAPAEIILGALQAAPEIGHTVLLVGDPVSIQRHLPTPCPRNIEIHPASQVVSMEEKPVDAIRKKRDSSMVVGVELVKAGQAAAFVSAGNTGAATAACHLSWRMMHGFHRPGIASELPSKSGKFVLLDVGASPDVDPEHLVEFALMGRAYAQRMQGKPNPTVHLLNIGEEPGKGNAFAKQAFDLLAKHDWFAGNIEGKDLFRTDPDVVVCDGFVGNIVLKTAEGTAEMIVQLIREAVPQHPIGKLPFIPLRGLMRGLWKKVDYAEIGGSPLLGLNGIGLICHGRSKAKAIRNALFQARRAIDNGLVDTLRESISRELGGIKK